MYNLPKISEPVEKLERLVRKEKDAQIQRRFHTLLLLASGEAKSRSAAARHLGVHRNTIADWLELYEEGGLEKLREIGEPGPDRPAVDPFQRDGEAQAAPCGARGVRELQRDPAVAW